MTLRLFFAVCSFAAVCSSSRFLSSLQQADSPPQPASYYDQTFYIVEDTDEEVTEALTYSDMQGFQALERGPSDPNPARFVLQDRDDEQLYEVFSFRDVQEYDSERQISLA